MDPLSVTASIIAVQQVTGSVVSAVYNYRKCVKNAPENVAKVVEELTGLFHAIENVLQTIGKERRLTGNKSIDVLGRARQTRRSITILSETS
jgi:hypothetical protein